MGSQSLRQIILLVQMSWKQPPPHHRQDLSIAQSLRLPQQTVRWASSGRTSVVGKQMTLSVLLTAGPAMSSKSPSSGSQAHCMTALQLERAA